jgi:hypothetical protein
MTEFQIGTIKPVECFREGWETIKSDYWTFFVVSLLGALIGGVSFYILLGAMMCGIFYCYLRKIDGYPAKFDDLWKGFDYFAPGLMVTILFVVPMFIIFGIVYAPLIAAAVMGTRLSPDELAGFFFGALAVDLVLAFVVTCFHTLLIFAFPLIVDRNLTARQAIATSARAVWRNLSGVAGLIAVGIVLSMFGIITCGVGMYFLMPVLMAGYAVAYRRVFPAANVGNFDQVPPPNFYKGI